MLMMIVIMIIIVIIIVVVVVVVVIIIIIIVVVVVIALFKSGTIDNKRSRMISALLEINVKAVCFLWQIFLNFQSFKAFF